jgi:hypothetical protein
MHRHLTVAQVGLVFIDFFQVRPAERIGQVRHRIQGHVERFAVVAAEVRVLGQALGLEDFVQEKLHVPFAEIGCHLLDVG